MSSVENLQPALKNPPFQSHAPLAFPTFEPYVGAQPDYLPLVAAAGMLLLKPHHIACPYLHL